MQVTAFKLTLDVWIFKNLNLIETKIKFLTHVWEKLYIFFYMKLFILYRKREKSIYTYNFFIFYQIEKITVLNAIT